MPLPHEKPSLNEEIHRSILKGISERKTQAELLDYFAKVSQVLSKNTYKSETKNLWQCTKDFLDAKESPFTIKLVDPKFKILSQSFYMTAGLHIIAGMTGHGKTLWAMQWAANAALMNERVLFVSLEMTLEDMAARELSKLIQMPLRDIYLRKWEGTKKQMIHAKVEEVSVWKTISEKIYITNYPTLDWKEMRPLFERDFFKLKPKLVIIDYAQMLRDSDSEEGRMSQMFSVLAREFKLMADRLNIAIVILSQLNRKAVEDSKRITNLKDLTFIPLGNEFIKESGGIAEAADSVQIVCIPQKIFKCPDHLWNQFQVIVDKSRKLGQQAPCLFPLDLKTMEFI